MKKRILCFLLVAALLLSGCGNNQAATAETSAAATAETTAIEWYYKNPVEEYKSTGITYEELKEKYSKAMDWFTFTRPARTIFEQKLEKYKEIG